MLNMIESNVANKIYNIRGIEVMLDSELAEIYQVETRVLNQAVKRNIKRFNDEDFMFELTDEEFSSLKSQIVTSSWGGKRKNPKVFTEQGVYMLASVLNSDFAIDVSKSIMRTFTKLRQYALQNKDIYSQLETLKKEIKENRSIEDQRFESIKNAIATLENMILEIDQAKSVKQIGFIHQGNKKMNADLEKLENLKKALLTQSQYAKIEITAMQKDEDENDLFLKLFEYACDVDYCYDNYTTEELIEFLKDDDFDGLIGELGFEPKMNEPFIAKAILEDYTSISWSCACEHRNIEEEGRIDLEDGDNVFCSRCNKEYIFDKKKLEFIEDVVE